VKIDWNKLGLEGAPRTLRDVCQQRNFAAIDAGLSVPAHDLALLTVDGGEDTKPDKYPANQSDIKGIRATSGPTFALLHYANVSDRVVMMRVKSTSGLSTALALPPTAGSNVDTVALMLPHGTADLEFEAQPIAIRELAVYPLGSSRPQ
jgi:hypothetical protein